MKNIALLIAVIITLGFASCGDEKKKKRKKGPYATLCKCMKDAEKMKSKKCVAAFKANADEWSNKIQDAGGDNKKLQAVIEESAAASAKLHKDCSSTKGSSTRASSRLRY